MSAQAKTLNAFFFTTHYFFLAFFKTLFLFPFWWYSRGLLLVILWCVRSMQNTASNLGLMVWIKNLFVPMYGETDIVSRFISFFLRCIMILGRSIALFFFKLLWKNYFTPPLNRRS